MLYAACTVVVGMTAGLQYVVKANQVTFNICIRIGDRIAHASLRRQIHHDARLVIGKNFVDKRLVGKISFDKYPFRISMLRSAFIQLLQAVFLNGYVIIVVHIVQTDDFHRGQGTQKLQNQVAADEPGRTSY